MKKLVAIIGCSILLSACGGKQQVAEADNGTKLATLMNAYWQDRLQLFPVEATGIGDNRYNNRLTITIAESFRDSLGKIYQRYLKEVSNIDTAGLSKDDIISYRLLRYEMEMGIEGLKYPTHLMPISQFWSFTLELPQLGSGTGNQPFNTVADYDNWLQRLSLFPAWADTAIANMRKGIAIGWVLPRSLTVKILPQLRAVVTTNDTASIFYGPIRNLPKDISNADSTRLDTAYRQAIATIVNPVYKKLHTFFLQEYLPKSRVTHGIKDIPGGNEYYKYCIKNWTTTELHPDSIYNTGVAEVVRMEAEMNKVKERVGFVGTLPQFFKHINNDKKFFPFSEPSQIIDSFWNIKKQEDPYLKKLFTAVPKTQFTIRQTEAFRAASASAEYNQGSEDGTRPGIFYVPVTDARKFNCVAMATLFLHEAIPGHHYQVSLQQENKNLPAFRRFLWYGAYGEGWAHYCETLGGELGLYDDPYQYFGHLSDGIHRAIRLVVDIGIHYKGMTREQAIAYMMAHELISEAEATAEIERYMAIPGQALSYKIGQLSILAARKKYEKEMGDKWNIASFHDEMLKYGCLPLNVLEEQLETWSKAK